MIKIWSSSSRHHSSSTHCALHSSLTVADGCTLLNPEFISGGTAGERCVILATILTSVFRKGGGFSDHI